MANLYLVDRSAGETALQLASGDNGAKVVLLQDGVYLNAEAANKAGREVYAVRRDVELRGLSQRVPAFVKQIGYDELVDLIVENKVINFA